MRRYLKTKDSLRMLMHLAIEMLHCGAAGGDVDRVYRNAECMLAKQMVPAL